MAVRRGDVYDVNTLIHNSLVYDPYTLVSLGAWTLEQKSAAFCTEEDDTTAVT